MPEAGSKSLEIWGRKALALEQEQDPRLEGVDLQAPSGVYASLQDGPRTISTLSERQMVDFLAEALSKNGVSIRSLIDGGQLPGYIFELFKDQFDALMVRITGLRDSLESIPSSMTSVRDGILLAIKEHVAVFCLQNYRSISLARLIGESEEVGLIVRRAKARAALTASTAGDTIDALDSLNGYDEVRREEMDILLLSISKHLLMYLGNLGYQNGSIFEKDNKVVTLPVEGQDERLIDNERPWEDPLKSNVQKFLDSLGIGSDYPFELKFEVVSESHFLTRDKRRDTREAMMAINAIEDSLRHQKQRVFIVFSLRKK